MKNYKRYTINDIFIIKLEYIRLMTTLIISNTIIFDKNNQINQMKII